MPPSEYGRPILELLPKSSSAKTGATPISNDKRQTSNNSDSIDSVLGKVPPRADLFWLRGDVERTRAMLDQWASCKRADQLGVLGCPTPAVIFEEPRPTTASWLNKKTGAKGKLEEINTKTVSFKPLPEARCNEIEIDRVLKRLGKPGLATGLLYFLYPRTGPYEVSTSEDQFYPKKLFGAWGSASFRRALASFCRKLHRDILANLARELSLNDKNSSDVSDLASNKINQPQPAGDGIRNENEYNNDGVASPAAKPIEGSATKPQRGRPRKNRNPNSESPRISKKDLQAVL